MVLGTQPLPPPTEHLRLDPKTQRLERRVYSVTVRSGPNEGATVKLEHVLLVGTQETAGLVLTDPTVSRHHLELLARPEGVLLRDLQSRNGTWVGELRVQEALVDPVEPTRIKLGRSVLELTVQREQLGRPDGRSSFGKFQGRSRATRELCGLLGRVAPTNSSVLLLGETGTGKEVLARELHAHSHRAQGPFVVFDCGAVAAELIESDLFGHVKGAFTGAVADRTGALLAADGGTLFLDEIGELPLALQPKLLRALDHLTVQPVGAAEVQRIDVRFVAATHRDLSAAVVEGTFRQDLYFRLAVVVAHLPPLRARPEDLPDLIDQLLHELGAADFKMPTDLMARLLGYGWPGNVRELRNVIQRVVLGLDASPDDAGTVSQEPTGFKEAKERVVEAFTREYLRDLMRRSGGNISQVARASGINRSHLHRLVAKYGIKASGDGAPD